MTVPEVNHETTAIRQVIADAQRLQSDADGFLALHTDDTVIVNFGGFRVRGKDALDARMRAALATPLADVMTTLEVVDVHYLRPDVAVVDAIKHISDRRDSATRSGSPMQERGTLTYVLVNQDGTWRIAVAQTTPVQA